MSNAYSFDFLRSEHKIVDEDDQEEHLLNSNNNNNNNNNSHHGLFENDEEEVVIPDVSHKSDLEKQFDVIRFLQEHRSSGCLPPSIIYKSLGIDLTSQQNENSEVVQMLLNNPKIRVEEIPDPENPVLTMYTFGYQAKFNNVRNKVGLLAQINRCKNGVKRSDLLDAYDNVEVDLTALVTAGDVLAVSNNEDKDLILFPRGDTFLVELDGHITANTNTNTTTNNGHAAVNGMVEPQLVRNDWMKTDVDPTKQIRRGEAIWVGGQWFRVSSAVKEGVPLAQQPPRAQAPPSVSLRKDLSRKNDLDGYIKPFTAQIIPLDSDLTPNHMENLEKAKESRKRLHKLVTTATTGTGSSKNSSSRHHHHGTNQLLLSSNASSVNPETLASTFVSTVSQHYNNLSHYHNKSSRTNHHATLLDFKQQAQKAVTDPALLYSHARRHGCTIDVRNLYLKTADKVPASEYDLQQLMIKYKLVDPNEQFRRPRLKIQNKNLDNDGKPKKRRYYEKKGQRITNTHLFGTEIGAALARAAEKQQQGKSVGDGGM